jgi:hypothetical protein
VAAQPSGKAATDYPSYLRTGEVAGTGWDEVGITWANGPAMGEPAARSGPFGPGSWTSTDVTRLAQGGGEVSLALATSSPETITFDSREGPHQPQLAVQTRPGSAAPPANSAAPGQWLGSTIEHVAAATAARYGTRDDHGRPMATLKIIASPGSGTGSEGARRPVPRRRGCWLPAGGGSAHCRDLSSGAVPAAGSTTVSRRARRHQPG